MSSTKAIPPPVAYDSDSDSDNEGDDSVTNVQLGLPDGPIEAEDESNPLVSRIGGRVAWLPTQVLPPDTVARCKHCNALMELLVQIFAPLEESPYDRTLLAWGCARPACQRKGAGSIRVIRHLQYNQRWAAKLEKKKARQAEREAKQRQQREAAEKRKQEEEAKKKVNPFASGGSGLGGGLFGGPANPFASAAASTPAASSTAEAAPSAQADEDDVEADADSEEDGDDDEDEADRLAEELAMKAALDQAGNCKGQWASTAPHYKPALYLNTISESSSSTKSHSNAETNKLLKKELAAKKAVAEQKGAFDDDEDAKGRDKEQYEKMMLMDDVMEKFIARVGHEGRQVVRYEMGGQPLPFSAGNDVFKNLWPKEKSNGPTSIHPSKAQQGSQAAAAAQRGAYDPSRVPPCEACGGKRTFEVQLMPNLVNTLRADNITDDETASKPSDPASTDAQTKRRLELEAALGRSLPAQPSADGITRTAAPTSGSESVLTRKTGLCWSTAFVFVCEKDCCLPRGDDDSGSKGKEGETWREEWVGVQFED